MIENLEGQVSWFDLDIWSGRTSPELSVPTVEKTSKRLSKKSSGLSSQKSPICVQLCRGGWTKSGCVYSALGDWSIAWRVHDAQFWGVPQRRKRIALVADFGGLSAPEILFERKGLSRDTESSGTAGQGTATRTERSVGEAGRCLNAWDVQSKHIQPESGLAESLYAGECRYGGGESYVMGKNKAFGISSYNSNAMKSSNQHSGIYEADTSRTLDLTGGSPACNQGRLAIVEKTIAIEGNGQRKSHKGDGWSETDQMYTLNATEHHAVCAGFQGSQGSKAQGIAYEQEKSPTLKAGGVDRTA